jgi:leucyl-tRNA synthetase
MHKKFDHGAIEKKWQEAWKASGLYDVGERDAAKEKEYVLVELPYPSGNLHVGHWYAFAIVDIYVRLRRMEGKQVLFPMGFDAFGLPAENAAIKNKLDPKNWTEQNMAFMRTQLESMGAAFSWDKTTSSNDPAYYKWTQWMFTQFFENGIAYRGTGIVNWCPGCNTVIANEQVLANGTCERSGDLIEKREMPQWMLRITQYADRLIDDLDALPWPEYIKESQRQWIGRKEGAHLPFTLSTGDIATVFTTRPDTLYGATYIALAPEHELVSKLGDHITNRKDIDTYVYLASQKDEVERMNALLEKTGVQLEGVTAINPATGEHIPVFVADYVLKQYGTGIVMGVPAHDERDWEFAKKFSLKSITVVTSSEETEEVPADDILKKPYTAAGRLINSGDFNGQDSEVAKAGITEKFGGKLTNTYRLRDWSIGRQRYWGVPIPIVYDPAGVAHVIPKEHLPWILPTDVDFTPTGEPPLAKSVELRERVERIFGKGWTPEIETMDTFVDSSWYFLRYLDAENTESLASLEKQNEWMPVDLYLGGAEHTTMHLLYSRFWHKALFDLGLVTTPEPYKKRLNRGLVLSPDGNKMSKSKGNAIDPDEQVRLLGADTVRMYLAFMGPYGEPTNYPWDMQGIAGLKRFLERVNGLSAHIADVETPETTKLVQKTIQKVHGDIVVYKFNTAISTLMILINHVEKSGLSKESYMAFLKLLAPFAPHLAEELWHEAGESESVHTVGWPIADVSVLVNDTVTIGVQIGGKMRGNVTVPVDASEETVREIIQTDPALVARLTSEPKRVIYVPNKIINFIL